MRSIWSINDIQKKDKREPLPEHISAAVIGGGMAGILCAWFLMESGVDTVVLEAGTVGSGQTEGTTAKITSQHGLIYSRLTETMGAEAAARYAQASQAAIDQYERIVDSVGIQCGFKRLPSYLYTECGDGMKKLEQERSAAVRAGIPAAIVYDTGLPFPVKMALRYENQAQFDPIGFLYGLSDSLKICQHTRVLQVKGHEIRTDRGTVKADHIVFASHFPFPRWPGFYSARMHQERSYVLALETEDWDLGGMYYGIDPDGLSFRNAGELVLVGGMEHRTGEGRIKDPYGELEKRAGNIWKKAEIKASWSAQDCMTLDSVPYIGVFSRLRPYWLVATGFGKWGMTNSMISAMAVCDAVTGQSMKEWELFSPQRKTFSASYKNFVKEMGHSIKNLAVLGGPRCPHLGCRLQWNPAERTWDCPCHGSRFRADGELLDEPSKKNIKNPGC